MIINLNQSFRCRRLVLVLRSLFELSENYVFIKCVRPLLLLIKRSPPYPVKGFQMLSPYSQSNYPDKQTTHIHLLLFFHSFNIQSTLILYHRRKFSFPAVPYHSRRTSTCSLSFQPLHTLSLSHPCETSESWDHLLDLLP